MRILQAVVLDFDGVLADTEPLHLRAFQEVLAARGVTLGDNDYYDLYLGFDDAGVFRAMARDRCLSWSNDDIAGLVARKAERFAARAASEPCLFPGVAERLRDWTTRVPVAIASGAFRHEIELILAGGGAADVVRTIVAAGDTPRGKPAPDPFERALELLSTTALGQAVWRAPSDPRQSVPNQLDPARSVAVEDSVWGIEAARTAGMKVVALATSYPRDRLTAAHLVVTSFEDLSLELLAEVADRS